jgi:hypothetical protein
MLGIFPARVRVLYLKNVKFILKLRRELMKKILATLILQCLLLAGCDSLRFAPNEAQKQNAWLHNRTTTIAADTARSENTSEKLQALTGLSQLQSRAFTSYCGLPREFPRADTAEEILAESSFRLAQTALQQSADRPDAWQLADTAFELAIGISALLGGVYGTRAVRFLKQARTKSKALQEIITGNELFKKEHKAYAGEFKQAHQNQSPQTRQIVAEIKA